MTRRINLSGELVVRDDEGHGRYDQFEDSFSARTIVTPRERTSLLKDYKFKCGGEIRTEIELEATEVGSSKQVWITGQMRLYEGISEATMDMDGVIPIAFTAPPDVETVKSFTVKSYEFRSSDEAKVRFVVMNIPPE